MSKKLLEKNNYTKKKLFKNIVLNYSSVKKLLQNQTLEQKKMIGLYYPINFEIDCISLIKKLQNDKL